MDSCGSCLKEDGVLKGARMERRDRGLFTINTY